MTRPSARPRVSLTDLGQPVLAIVVALLFIVLPLWLVAVTSAKPAAETQMPSLRLPVNPQVGQNYSDAFRDGSMLQGLVNSVLVVAPTVAVTVVASGMAAWVFARRSGRLSAGLYALAISGLLLPPSVITISLELRILGLQTTRPGLILAYVAIYLSVAIFFMTGFIRTLPREVEDAARIDGAGPVRTYFSIVLPLLRPVVATSVILVTLLTWNDVFYAFFLLGGGDQATLPLNLYKVASTQLFLNNWHLISAFVVLMSIPLVGLFLVAQRRIVSGLTNGAVK